jgi:hypothetical protein
MSFHDESLAKIKKLDFRELSRTTRPDSVVGTIDVSRLDDLARLDVVVRIDPETNVPPP